MTTGLVLSIPQPRVFSQEAAATDLDRASRGPRVTALRSELSRRLKPLIAKHEAALGAASRIGIAVVDASSGALVFESGSNEPFAAASNAKIITTAAALDLLGPEFHFRTEILGSRPDANGVVAGDLYLRGRGNPGFDDRDMVAMIRSLKAQGIRRIAGSIVVDNSYFDEHNLPPHFDEQPDEDAGFRAPIAATSYNFNAWTLIARPSLSGTGPARIELTPPNDYVKVVSTLTTIPTGRTALRLSAREVGKRLVVQVGGQIQAQVARRRFRKRAPDPVQFVGTGLARALADGGIAVRNKSVRSGQAPANSPVLAIHESPPLATMVRGMGKYSNNFVAELLLKVIGAEVLAAGQPATWQNGVDAVRGFLTRAGLKSNTYRYENGSGLFDSNQLSPMQLNAVLQFAQRNLSWGPDFFASLSLSSADGTLRKRMGDTVAARRIRAKTGTLAHASALSGIAAVDRNRPLLFSILVNDFAESEVGIARSFQNEVAVQLIEVLEKH